MLGAVDIVAKPGGAHIAQLGRRSRRDRGESARRGQGESGAAEAGCGGRDADAGESGSRRCRSGGDGAFGRRTRAGHYRVVDGWSRCPQPGAGRLCHRIWRARSSSCNICRPVLRRRWRSGWTGCHRSPFGKLSIFSNPGPARRGSRPGGVHLVFDRHGRMRFSRTEPHLGMRPAVDLTLESAVEVWGGDVVAVILTGMGVDGAPGAAQT